MTPRRRLATRHAALIRRISKELRVREIPLLNVIAFLMRAEGK